ncbi:YcgL domain-containing protein [Endozoicomonas euniceicola]|uniref:YcgL domain-containing protein NX720_19420 n=1 Tax=Endozoicomonas euniceicola TaxID=1234143 RepID=A0ABY6GQJ0_9GAMM|nr:YcgL domain-containing protein [Endozoicomonas euniceicola]UYM15020.1 YcgL domain-containing protein [Endozoicomonas euniceicola]
MKKLLVSIYKSSRRDEMYLYVQKQERLQKVPAPLLEVFGKEQHVMDLLLTPERQLARVEADQVINDIETRGFFLQMPPSDLDSQDEQH